jgi:hypothetical protein
MDLNTAVQLIKSLEAFVQAQRSEFDKFEENGKKMTSATQYKNVVMRRRRPNVRLQPLGDVQTQSVDDEVTGDTAGKDQFRRDSFLPIMDMLLSALQKRRCSYSELAELFGFLSQLRIIEDNEIRQHAQTLVHTYNADLEDSLAEELIQFRSMLVSFQNEFDSVSTTCSFELFMYKLLTEKYLQSTFPNTEIMLRIYLCLMVSNASGERSFSRLKHIKNHLRTSMHQNRLVWLSLMSIESDIMRTISFDDIIDEFARRKSRKVVL